MPGPEGVSKVLRTYHCILVKMLILDIKIVMLKIITVAMVKIILAMGSIKTLKVTFYLLYYQGKELISLKTTC